MTRHSVRPDREAMRFLLRALVDCHARPRVRHVVAHLIVLIPWPLTDACSAYAINHIRGPLHRRSGDPIGPSIGRSSRSDRVETSDEARSGGGRALVKSPLFTWCQGVGSTV